MVAKLVSVFTLGFVWFSASIPLGLALGLGPYAVGTTAWISYDAGVVLTVAVGKPIRDWMIARFGGKAATDTQSLIRRAWDRYGVVGLSFLAPITIGSWMGAALGLSLGVSPRRLIVGMVLGAAFWAVIITGALFLGIVGTQALR